MTNENIENTDSKELEQAALARAELVRIARERFRLAEDAERKVREIALDDLKFSVGEQWDEGIKKARELDLRPCLTINRLPQTIRQITNDQRQNRPSIKVSPVDDSADVNTAKILQGIIRHIEYNSNADVAYDTAFDGAVRKGFGYIRVITDYCDPTSFDQDILIKRVLNSFNVYLDPSHKEPDASDANWGFIFEDMSKEDFKNQYPKAEVSSEEWSSLYQRSEGWVKESTVRVAEYFYKEYQEDEVVLLYSQLTDTKRSLLKSKMPEVLPEGFEIKGMRKTVVPKIKWVKLNGVEVLEETEWLGKWIPIVPVLGDEVNVDGERILEGIVRHAKDPQRMYNYWVSSETETIALAPRAPFIGAEGQFEGHESSWQEANQKNHSYLEYKPTTIMGQLAPPPARQVYEPPVQAITSARMQSADDIKSTTGVYDASLGNRSNENSGVAIQRRNQQAQTSNFHYIDNLSRAMRHLGRILVDLIPKIYDTERAIQIIGEDDEKELIFINQFFEKDGKQVQYNLGAGKYDVMIAQGPSYATKRQEAVTSMLDFVRSWPEAATYIGDLMAKNMDWPGADEIASRLKKALPPGIADEEIKDDDIPDQVKAQIDQSNQMIDQLTQALNDANEKINTKVLELESKERIEMAKLQVAVESKLADLGSKEAIILLQQEIAEIQQRMNLVGQNEPIQNQNGAGSEQLMAPQNFQQPTDGLSSGQPMEF